MDEGHYPGLTPEDDSYFWNQSSEGDDGNEQEFERIFEAKVEAKQEEKYQQELDDVQAQLMMLKVKESTLRQKEQDLLRMMENTITPGRHRRLMKRDPKRAKELKKRVLQGVKRPSSKDEELMTECAFSFNKSKILHHPKCNRLKGNPIPANCKAQNINESLMNGYRFAYSNCCGNFFAKSGYEL